MENFLISNEFNTFTDFFNLFRDKIRYRKKNIFSKDEDLSLLPDGSYRFELVRYIPEDKEYDFVSFRIHLYTDLNVLESLKDLGIRERVSLVIEIIIEIDDFSRRVDKLVFELEGEEVNNFNYEMLTPHIKEAIAEYNSYIFELQKFNQ